MCTFQVPKQVAGEGVGANLCWGAPVARGQCLEHVAPVSAEHNRRGCTIERREVCVGVSTIFEGQRRNGVRGGLRKQRVRRDATGGTTIRPLVGKSECINVRCEPSCALGVWQRATNLRSVKSDITVEATTHKAVQEMHHGAAFFVRA
jgi:hypothetical protein